MKNIITLFLSVCCLLSAVRFSAFGAGTDPSSFLSYGVGARAFGLGSAYTAVAEDAAATYYNSGAVGSLVYKELLASHCILWENTGYTFLGYVYPLPEKGAIGFNLISLNSSGAESRDLNNIPSGKFSDSKTGISFIYGNEVTSKLYAGIAAKFINSSLLSNSVSFLTCDFGAYYKALKSLNLGVNVQNIVPVTLANTDDKLPLNVKFGASQMILSNKMMLVLDVNSTSGMLFNSYAFGFEYDILKFMSLRLGKNPQELNAGFGIKQRNFTFDYALANNDYLGASHRISLGIKLGKRMQLLDFDDIRPVVEPFEDENKEQREQQFKVTYQDAVSAYRAGDYTEAINKFKTAEEILPGDALVPIYLQKLESIAKIIPKATDQKNKVSDLIRRGIIAYLEGDDDTAVKTVAYALSLKPDFAVERLLNEIEQKTGIKGDRTALTSGLSVVDQKLIESETSFKRKDYLKTIEICEGILQLEPNNVRALKQMGSAFYTMGEKQKAKQFWQKALKIEPDARLQEFINKIQ